jgi:hypothetical protein
MEAGAMLMSLLAGPIQSMTRRSGRDRLQVGEQRGGKGSALLVDRQLRLPCDQRSERCTESECGRTTKSTEEKYVASRSRHHAASVRYFVPILSRLLTTPGSILLKILRTNTILRSGEREADVLLATIVP